MFKVKSGKYSGLAWARLDRGATWALLKKALTAGQEGAEDAVREAYAYITNEADGLAQANVNLLHHEVTKEGSVLLNRGGLFSAAKEFASIAEGPKAAVEAARRHLAKHFEELKLNPPDSLAPTGEQDAMGLLANLVTGEMQVEDVPLSPAADLQSLLAGDTEPLQVVVEIAPGKSKRGWEYTHQALDKIVGEVQKNTLAGYLGHQKAEDVSNQFLPPVTHWVGAKWQDGKAYFRGVIDTAAQDLKRWVKAKRVTQVSIFGVPTLRTVGNQVQVVDYQPLSIDWTPLGRAGMGTRIVAAGEMDELIPPANNTKGGKKAMTLAELIAALKELGVAPRAVIGEMGWKPQDVAAALGVKLDEVGPAIDAERWNGLQTMATAMGEMAQLYGMGKDTPLADLVAAVKASRQVEQAQAGAQHGQLVDKVIGEMVANEKARPLVKRLLNAQAGTDEAALKAAVGELLKLEEVKVALAGMLTERRPPASTGGDSGKPSEFLRTKTVSI
jgi:hypothetical protein